jgi:Iron-sulfur cluster assembly accessory protein
MKRILEQLEAPERNEYTCWTIAKKPGVSISLSTGEYLNWLLGYWIIAANAQERLPIMSVSEQTEALPIQMSDAAAAKVKSLITEEENPELKLRVYITGGGCSGFQYGFTFDEKINEGDTVIEKNGVTMVVDSMSLQYLVGGVVDYIEGLEGSRFLVSNPNATSTCGCGSSFSI